MKEIISKDNRIIREAASLSEKKFRDKLGLFSAEGPNVVREALSQNAEIKYLLLKGGALNDELIEISEKAEEKGVELYALNDICFSKVSSTENSQGIIAIMPKKEYNIKAFFGNAKGKNILVLDRIQDPGNMGTLLRTAEAMGFAGAMLIKGCADPYSPKVVRSCAGNIFRFPLISVNDGKEALDILKEHKKTVYSAAMNGKACFECALSADVAVVIGNEGNGVSDYLMENTALISIPMEGRTESLNAALAGAMIMYEALRQRY